MPSTAISHFDYDAAGQELRVTFTSGGIYVYTGVPAAIYDGLRQAWSRGRYFATAIRGRYPCRRVGTDESALWRRDRRKA